MAPDDDLPPLPPLRQRLLRLALRICLALALAVLASLAFDWLKQRISVLEAGTSAPAMVGLIAVMLLAYALVLAVPFMPGIEIGIALMVIEGAAMAPFVYLATLLGLGLAFAVGYLMPMTALHRLLQDLGWLRACLWVDRLARTPPDQRPALLAARLPRWLAPLLMNWRHVTLAVLLNMPGNTALGGGGGLMLIAGLSGLFRPAGVMAMLALAVAPVPLVVWLWGAEPLLE